MSGKYLLDTNEVVSVSGLDMRQKAPEGRTERSGQDRWSAVNEEKKTGR